MYFRNAKIILLCYALDDADSIQQSLAFVSQQPAQYEHALILLVGCKQDLPCAVKLQELHQWRNKHKNIVSCCMTSAKTKHGIENLKSKMNKLVKQLFDRFGMQKEKDTEKSITSTCIAS